MRRLGNDMNMEYTEEAIRGALILLDSIKFSGIDNAKRIVQIEMILQNPLKGDKDDGKDSV